MTAAVAGGAAAPAAAAPIHRARRLGIDTGLEAVVYLHRDSAVVHAEGFDSQTRVELRHGGHAIPATLQVVWGPLLAPGEAGLSEIAWTRLGATEGAEINLAHPAPVESLGHVRAKIHGHHLKAPALTAIAVVAVAMAGGGYGGVALGVGTAAIWLAVIVVVLAPGEVRPLSRPFAVALAALAVLAVLAALSLGWSIDRDTGFANVVRLASWAVAPTVAGLVMARYSLAAPLVIGAAIKIVYDLLLYFAFRRVRPPEELGRR